MVKFHMEMLRSEKWGPRNEWRRLLYTMYGSLLLITVTSLPSFEVE